MVWANTTALTRTEKGEERFHFYGAGSENQQAPATAPDTLAPQAKPGRH